MEKMIIVLDCGATNVRAIAINENGKVLAKSSTSNNTQPDPEYPEYKIWDIDEIWGKLASATREVTSQIPKASIAGVTVTTFGVDGAPMTKDGEMLYPIISWACQRTAPIMENIEKYIPIEQLYGINGVNQFSFNTINKLIWLKENKPQVLEQADYFVFISSILAYKLSGELATDMTMAGTSMLTDIKARDFSTKILDAIGYPAAKFAPKAEAGETVGKVTDQAAKETGLPKGIPVLSAGHDTQFAIFGSGASEYQPVLSSGIWEILMARTRHVDTGAFALEKGVTCELDPVPGLLNLGVQWLGSGILEWIKKMFYTAETSNLESDALYSLMIAEAEKVTNSKLDFSVDFLNENGVISGLGINTSRQEIYRAALQALAVKTKESLSILEKVGGFNAQSIICVGGGSKNSLWNTLREEALGIPVKVVEQQEATVIGAAMFAMAGIGVYASPEEARKAML